MTLGTDRAVVVSEHETDNTKRKTTTTWEHQDLAQVRIRVMRGHEDVVKSCQFCDNDRKFLTASYDQSMILWDFTTGKSLHIYENGHTMNISKARMNSDASRIVSSGWDKKVNLWDANTGSVLWTGKHGGIVTCCNYSNDGQFVVSASDLDNTIKVWDAKDGQVLQEIKDLHSSTITSVAFSPSDERLITTSMDRTTKFYDLKTQCNTITLKGHINVVTDACFTKDERKFATVSYDKAINIYDVSTGTYRSQGPQSIQKAHENCISCVDYSTDGLLLATGGFDGAVSMWDVENCIQKLKLLGHSDWVEDVCFSSDQKWILSCSKDKTARLWNIEEADKIPMVMEKKKAIGLKVFKCSECGKPFSHSEEDKQDRLQVCVFCRLKANSY